MTLCVMLLLTTRVSAAGEEARPTARKPRLRAVTVSGRVEEVRVAARTATRIRFDTAVDAAHTRLDDGHGRFEPLLLGNGFLVVTPREELPAGERVSLEVVLSDGTRVPFVLAAGSTEVERRMFHAGALSGFVVRVRNPAPLRPWEPGVVRVRQEGGGEVEVLALRMGPGSLPPGGWGWLVVVTRALPRHEQARFELELRGRSGASEAPPKGVAL
jgi:uncharacterized protein DUF2381